MCRAKQGGIVHNCSQEKRNAVALGFRGLRCHFKPRKARTGLEWGVFPRARYVAVLLTVTVCECVECVAFGTCLLFSIVALRLHLDQHHPFSLMLVRNGNL